MSILVCVLTSTQFALVDVAFESRYVHVTAHDESRSKTQKGEERISMSNTLFELILEIKQGMFQDRKMIFPGPANASILRLKLAVGTSS
jgi:hypothetical protein